MAQLGSHASIHAGVPLAFQTVAMSWKRQQVEFRWASVYAVDGDELSSEHRFFDQADLLGQLGLLPG